MFNCPGVTNVPSLPPDLERLRLHSLDHLTLVPKLASNLQSLHIEDCPQLVDMGSLLELPKVLKELVLYGTPELPFVLTLPEGLEELTISEFTLLQRLPSVPASLKTLLVKRLREGVSLIARKRSICANLHA